MSLKNIIMRKKTEKSKSEDRESSEIEREFEKLDDLGKRINKFWSNEIIPEEQTISSETSNYSESNKKPDNYSDNPKNIVINQETEYLSVITVEKYNP